MSEILSTKDYDIFTKLVGNKYSAAHMRKIMKSIQKSNLLNIHPIIVSKNMEVLDGNHRLEAAKQLGLEIYYIQSDILTDEHIAQCNANQRVWETDNFIQLYALRNKIPEYVKLHEMLQESKLLPKSLMNLILGNVSNAIFEVLKTGMYKFPQSNEYEIVYREYLSFMKYVLDKRVTPMSMFRSGYFTVAFRWLILHKDFNKNIFLSKLDLRWFDLKPQRDAKSWYELLIGIYNFKNHARINPEIGSL